MDYKEYIQKKMESVMIYHKLANFHKSQFKAIPDKHITLFRIILTILVIISIGLYGYTN